jgi:tetratricopeptide (TPR) repeat protein
MTVRPRITRNLAWFISVVLVFAGAFAYFLQDSRHEAANLPPLPVLVLDEFATPIQEQIRAASQAARQAPNDAVLNRRLGMILHAYKLNTGAIVSYRRARLLDPGSYEAAYYLGIVQLQAGNDSAALEQLRAVLELNPGYRPARLRVAELLMKTGQLEEAGQLYTTLLDSPADAARAHYGLGQIAFRSGNTETAITHYLQALQLFESFGPVHYALALAYRDEGETQAAGQHMAYYQQYRKNGPPHNDPLLEALDELDISSRAAINRARQLFESGRYPEAAQLLETAVSIDPQSVEAHMKLVRLYSLMGDFEQLEQHYRAVVSLDPDLPAVHLLYGQALGDTGRYEQAIDSLRKVLETEPDHVQANTYLGQACEELGRNNEALKHYRLAVAGEPDNRFVNYLLGRRLLADGQTAEAKGHLEQATGPEDEQTVFYLYHTAIALDAADRRELARPYLQRAREVTLAGGHQQLLGDIIRTLAQWQEPDPQ